MSWVLTDDKAVQVVHAQEKIIIIIIKFNKFVYKEKASVHFPYIGPTLQCNCLTIPVFNYFSAAIFYLYMHLYLLTPSYTICRKRGITNPRSSSFFHTYILTLLVVRYTLILSRWITFKYYSGNII